MELFLKIYCGLGTWRNYFWEVFYFKLLELKKSLRNLFINSEVISFLKTQNTHITCDINISFNHQMINFFSTRMCSLILQFVIRNEHYRSLKSGRRHAYHRARVFLRCDQNYNIYHVQLPSSASYAYEDNFLSQSCNFFDDFLSPKKSSTHRNKMRQLKT